MSTDSSPNLATIGEAISGVAKLAGIAVVRFPRLVPWVSVQELGSERLEFYTDNFSFVLSGEFWLSLYRDIGPFLDGRKTVEQILQLSGGTQTAPVKTLFLQVLQQNSLLVDGADFDESAPHQSILHFFSHFTSHPKQMHLALSQSRIALVAPAPFMPVLERAFLAVGFVSVVKFLCMEEFSRKSKFEKAFEVLVVMAVDSFDDETTRANEAALNTKQRWLRIIVDSVGAVIGPTFLPFQTACLNCIQLRAKANGLERPEQRRSSLYSKHSDSLIHPGPLTEIASGYAALEVCRIVTGFAAPQTIGRYYRTNVQNLSLEGHAVLKVPRCPSCGHGWKLRQNWNR